MKSGSIQLPLGFIPDQKTENDLQFNLPLNYKKNLLFDKLPYVTKLDNPVIENVINGNNADDLSVQKFFLATDLLQDSIQNLSEFEKIVEFSHKIHKYDDDVDDDTAVNTAGSSSTLVADRCRFLPTSSLNDTKKFLLDINVNKKIEAIESTSPVRSSNQKIEFPDSLSKIFPIAHKTDADFDEFDDKSDDESISEVQMTVRELNNSNLLSNLQFFSGGKKNEEKLFENVAKNVGIINDSNKKFLEFLTSKFGKNLLTKNKIQIHLDSGQIFHDNKITSESLYDFKKKKDLNKKELKVNLPIGDDFDYYVIEILTNIKDNTFDLNSDSTSKFLFYNFNTFRSLLGKEIFTIRHSIIANNEYALETLQNRNWSYFIIKLIYILNNDLDVELLQDEYNEENSLVNQTFQNLNYCKQIYENVFDDLAYFFHRKLKETPNIFVEKMEEDLAREIFYRKKIKEQENSTEVFQKFYQFFFKTGRYPSNNNLAIIPSGVIPAFVNFAF